MCYLDHIRRTWYELLDGDQAALHKVDEITVTTLELTAPRVSTSDASTLRMQLSGGRIFGAFNDQERGHILTRLLSVDGLIPSLHTFFRDLQYLQACVDCVKRLISLSPGQTLFSAMERAFTGANQRHGQVVLQVAPAELTCKPGSMADQVDLGYQQIHVHAMRNFLDMPREPQGEDTLAIPTMKANTAALGEFADLAQCLGFESPEITALQQYPHPAAAAVTPTLSKPVLVTSGRGEIKSQRCGLPRKQTYEEDRKSLYLSSIYDAGDDRGEGLTSFFVRRSVFFAFYGKHAWITSNGTRGASGVSQQEDHGQSQEAPVHREEDTNSTSGQVNEGRNLEMIQYTPEQYALDQERLEREHRNEERLRQETQEQERLERLQQEWQTQERLEREWREQQERERQEQLEREKQEQLERERQEQLERERQEQLERERQDQLERERQEQQERERQEQQQERERQEQQQERERQEQLERERQEYLERERQEYLERERQEQLERERQEQLERERQEQLERERQEQLERERQEQLERERQEQLERERQEQLERERQEQLERERQDQLERERQEQLERERQAQQERERQEQLERERQEQQERERQEQLERERQEQLERERQEQLERERQEKMEQERQEQLERERQEQQEHLEQARMREPGNRGTHFELDKLLSNSPYNPLPTSGNDDEGLEKSGNQEPEGALDEAVAPVQRNAATHVTSPSQSTQEESNTKVRIVFKIWQRGNWKDLSHHLVDPSDPSEVERMAKKNMRKKIRLFDTNLRTLAPQDCFEAATANGSNAIFLIPEANMNIVNEVTATASDIGANTMPRRELGRKREAVDEISGRHHLRKKQIV